MKTMITLFLCAFLMGDCSKKVKEAEPLPNSRIEELRAKYQEKKTEAQKTWDNETGWPDVSDCDGTLWAGLAKAAGAPGVLLDRAKHVDGKIHRRPGKPCFENGVDLGAKSTVSKDMLLGYVYGMWRAGNVGELSYLVGYGVAHNWIMGDPANAVGQVVLTFNGIATLCRSINTLGGSCEQALASLPVNFSTMGEADYEQHLAALGILLWGEVNPRKNLVESIPQGALDVLTSLAYSHANDALFQTAYTAYTSGDYTRSIELLLGDYSYPSYVRGSESYKLVHWLFVADLILRKFPNPSSLYK